MENAIWNGQIYTATDIAESYELEKNIRKASGRKELICPDPDCSNPILRYCHGEIKCAFFAHLNNCACDYAEFDKENTQIMRHVNHALYESFISRGFNVQIEVKLLSRHYTHLLFTMPSGKKIAIELGVQGITANRIDYLAEQYKNVGAAVKWIVISDYKTLVKENKTFFLKRYLLNESKMKDVLILNCEGTEITQYIVDTNQYTYNGKKYHSENYPDTYSETSSLDNLTFEDDELSIYGFHSRYNEWLKKKKRAFDKKISQIEQETRRKNEYQRQRQSELMPLKTISQKANKINCASLNKDLSSASLSYEDRKKSILHLMDQQTEQARDKTGVRWIRCERCGAIDTEDKFWTYGGLNYATLGICYKCKNDD